MGVLVRDMLVPLVKGVVDEARAVLAWYDEYREKAAEYPAMQYVGAATQIPNGSVSFFLERTRFGLQRDARKEHRCHFGGSPNKALTQLISVD